MGSNKKSPDGFTQIRRPFKLFPQRALVTWIGTLVWLLSNTHWGMMT